MTGEPEFEGVERLLRSVPAPQEVPGAAAAAAREAALERGPGREAVVDSTRRSRASRRRLFPAAAVLLVAVAAALVIGVGGRTVGAQVQQRVTLVSAGTGHASGSLALDAPAGVMRPVVLTVKNLPPAPAGHYYEMWMGDGYRSVGMMVFNTGRSGAITVHSEMPAGLSWTRCWVTLEDTSNDSTVSVLTSTA